MLILKSKLSVLSSRNIGIPSLGSLYGNIFDDEKTMSWLP